MATRYFDHIDSLKEGKSEYHELLHRFHPDKEGGNNEICKEIVKQFNEFLGRIMQNAFNHQGDSKTGDADIRDFVDILRKIKDFNMDIEIIGHWIWAFRGSYEYKDQLKSMGFWFSKAKRAWVYNGGKRNFKMKGRYSMNQIRNMHPVQRIKDYKKEEREAIEA